MSERKAVIKNADMGEEMQQDAVDCATQALEKFNIEKVIAAGHFEPNQKHFQINIIIETPPPPNDRYITLVFFSLSHKWHICVMEARRPLFFGLLIFFVYF